MTNAFDPERDNQVAHLLKLAGRRPSPGADRLEQARDAARVEWQRAMRVRGRRRMLTVVAAAVGMAVLSGAAWLWTVRSAPDVERVQVATVQQVVGAVRAGDGARGQAAGIAGTGTRLDAGTRVEVSGQGRASFQLLDGASVRLAGDTVAIFTSPGRLDLVRGVVYVDADPARRRGSVTVTTPFGTVSHAGTQFELRLQPGSLEVRVREGEVSVAGREGPLSSTAGEALVIRRDRPAERRKISPSGPEWAWVTTVAPPFTLEGATVPAFLQWVSREQGWRWEYADTATRHAAERTVLHGSVDGLTPEDALFAVLPASGLTSRRDGDRLIVSGSR